MLFTFWFILISILNLFRVYHFNIQNLQYKILYLKAHTIWCIPLGPPYTWDSLVLWFHYTCSSYWTPVQRPQWTSSYYGNSAFLSYLWWCRSPLASWWCHYSRLFTVFWGRQARWRSTLLCFWRGRSSCGWRLSPNGSRWAQIHRLEAPRCSQLRSRPRIAWRFLGGPWPFHQTLLGKLGGIGSHQIPGEHTFWVRAFHLLSAFAGG